MFLYFETYYKNIIIIFFANSHKSVFYINIIEGNTFNKNIFTRITTKRTLNINKNKLYNKINLKSRQSLNIKD